LAIAGCGDATLPDEPFIPERADYPDLSGAYLGEWEFALGDSLMICPNNACGKRRVARVRCRSRLDVHRVNNSTFNGRFTIDVANDCYIPYPESDVVLATDWLNISHHGHFVLSSSGLNPETRLSSVTLTVGAGHQLLGCTPKSQNGVTWRMSGIAEPHTSKHFQWWFVVEKNTGMIKLDGPFNAAADCRGANFDITVKLWAYRLP